MPLELIRLATAADAEAIARLVNQAYRPVAGLAGWTHEAEWVAGNRTDTEQVLALLQKPQSRLLLGVRNASLVACVHVERMGAVSYIGMLAVISQLQARGAGKQLLAAAERYASQQFAAERVQMRVLNTRTELLAFYLRRGYQSIGTLSDYPLAAGVGAPRVAGLRVLTLEKHITADA
jgi:ribosomal protein S18 acetylase RimI-like enzyme